MAMSFFRYPGGKNKLKDIIIGKILTISKDCNTYVEPFFGGGSIGLNLLKDHHLTFSKIWINDKDVGIVCLWDTVIRFPQSLKDKIKNFTPTVETFETFKRDLLTCDTIEESEVIELGFKKLVVHQTSYSGLGTKSGGPLGGKSQKSKYKIDCRWSTKSIYKKINDIHNLFYQYNSSTIQCTDLDFQKIIEQSSNEKTFIYLDPPYYIKGNELYQHGFSQKDHERLAETLKNTKSKWLLSYDDCPEIRELYKWANIEEINVNYTINTSRTKKELLINR